jgi:hypothetical protein
MGWLYSRLVASNSFAPEYRREDAPKRTNASGNGLEDTESEELQPPTTPSDYQLTRLNNSIREFMAM